MRINDVLKKPKITEKTIEATKKNVYCFEVLIGANKYNIKDAVEKLFKVEVADIKTLIKKGKIKRVGKKQKTKKRPNIKLAYITLRKGRIDLFPS